ncbi:carbonic anhydrase [Prosthecomicrobium pneumaticum]|uniref:Carbonic anhydrase n=1 Tax=Prosthecomicrobium pneumaticum TaxID=81895 RepID=A0A7W9FQS6_9HYPH|nr:carbonic anhydrase [Prosthecomicrobium pneumaticum]
MALIAACPLCTGIGHAAEGAHWSYEGEAGPDKWGALEAEYGACSAGSQQSPIDITGVVKAELPDLGIAWKPGGEMVNNGHTIQVNAAPGGALTRGDRRYDLVQYHFHAPSEHLLDGHHFPMEVHFVHKNAATGGLGVLGVFLKAGASNADFAALAAAFPAKAKQTAPVAAVDPTGLLPASRGYWAYEGSLTTPPCSEIVDWMVAQEPIEVAQADIDKFTAIYSMNARPALAINRRFVLGSK